MGFLVCENCGSFYELKKDDSPYKLAKCSCGGKLRYSESLYGDSSKSLKKSWNDQSKSVKIIIILLNLTSIFLISLLFIAVAFPHYDGSEFSFDYPSGWIIDSSFPDMVTGTKGPENKFSILKVYDHQIYYLMVASLS
ncbi:MAG: hypothetical protein Q7U35_00790 [Methanobacteriaceae archaeon]|nr:hypothetical protein [Methanobacteriaceae archaeon]MDP2837228.1 hypothetical protein [Methanobacteriaceae archaeon]MDP3036053.1 hypothetical protein [Methanobacteriaceae archaeon]MDP3485128.1 hypothetical protein [Methanobacteriaceae archaeon]MDP3623719.1 hypothetical protein [Methanobacteriaceae archaeon]